MAEGSRTFIVLSMTQGFELEKSSIVIKDGLLGWDGDVDEPLQVAGYNGVIYYHALEKLFGIPMIRIGEPNLKLWWTMPELKEPENGAFRNNRWGRQPTVVARLGTAEFLYPLLKLALTERLEAQPELLTLPRENPEQWLNFLLVLLKTTFAIGDQLHSVTPTFDVNINPDDKTFIDLPTRTREIVEFIDGTRLRLDAFGYHLIESDTVDIPLIGRDEDGQVCYRTEHVFDAIGDHQPVEVRH